MKRFWLVLLSLGLIVAFSTSAMALDVKFSGEYYAAGMYMDKTGLRKTSFPAGEAENANPSTAFFFQRLRLGTQFIVSPGLSLIARADIMERAWGAARTAPAAPGFGQSSVDSVTYGPNSPLGTGTYAINSAGTRAENENIAFDLLYINYASPIGLFGVGYQIDGAWGTVFGDTSVPTPKITYALPIGGFAIIAQMGKNPDGERSLGLFAQPTNPLNNAAAADRDSNFYTLAGRYAWKAGEAGLLFKWIREAGPRSVMADPLLGGFADTGFKQDVYVVVPYVKAKFGAFAVQAEFTYATGKRKWEGIPAVIAGRDADIKAYNGWLDVVGDFGMFYAGLTGAHVSGEDPGTVDIEGQLTGGMDWNPCLIMFNSDRQYWMGQLTGYGATQQANYGIMTNAWFGQLRAGVRPTDKLDIMLSYSYAKADKTPGAGYDEREYGQEIDLTATYKITNNLSYMLGGGYWMVGKYYKGNRTTNNDLQDQMMILNKLTLTF